MTRQSFIKQFGEDSCMPVEKLKEDFNGFVTEELIEMLIKRGDLYWVRPSILRVL